MRADDPRHGTLAGHAAGCRERCCGEAKLAYDKRRRYYGPRTVDSTGTVRRIRALQAMGWAFPDIARAAGLSERTISNPTFRGGGTIYATTAEGVRRAYDELSMKLPTGRYVGRQRRAAQRKGWLPPLAWDDDRIDDPNYKPSVASVREDRRRRDLIAEWDHLRSLGVSMHQAAKQLGVTVDAIEKALERAKERKAS